jgi:3-keto-5-aminohexanoate cleavage enzyme
MAEGPSDYPVAVEEYIAATGELIEAGACAVHLDYLGVEDDEGHAPYKEIAPVDAYGTILKALREKFGQGFVPEVNTFSGDSFEDCMAPAVAGLMETSPLAAGGPIDFVIPAAKRLNELGIRPGIGIHNSGEVELAKRRFIDTGLIEKPYHFYILYGMPFNLGNTVRSGTWLRDAQDAAQHLFLMTEQIKSLDADATIVVIAAGRATIYLTTLATMLGLHIRVGTEDTIWRAPNRDEKVASNLDLLTQAKEIAHHLGRDPASADEWRRLVGIPT